MNDFENCKLIFDFDAPANDHFEMKGSAARTSDNKYIVIIVPTVLEQEMAELFWDLGFTLTQETETQILILRCSIEKYSINFSGGVYTRLTCTCSELGVVAA